MRQNILASLLCANVLLSWSCTAKSPRPPAAPATVARPTPTPPVSWSQDPTEDTDNKALQAAWKNFERSQQYRLAQASDRVLTPAALARVMSNNSNQAFPSLIWWGASGYRGFVGKDFLAAIVVDPNRTDRNRYGLVVLAAVVSQGKDYKPYWAAKEEDMENYLLSPASGSVFMECYRRDGTEETKELVWDKKSRQFRLVHLR